MLVLEAPNLVHEPMADASIDIVVVIIAKNYSTSSSCIIGDNKS